MKTHLLIEYESFTQTVHMSVAFFKNMERSYPIQVRDKKCLHISMADLQWCDIVLSIRSMCGLTNSISKLCKKYNRIYIYLIDDNFFLYRNKEVFKKLRIKELEEIIGHTDILASVNPYLIRYISKKCGIRRSVRMNTAVREEEIYDAERTETGQEFKIVYYSNNGSADSIEDIIVPILSELSKRVPKKIILHLLGITKIEGDFGTCKIVCVPHMILDEFRIYLRDGNFDLGIAPLADDDLFNKCKYFNKFVEYTMAGIPGIYSNCPPYTFVVKDGVNGFLCNNTKADWLSAIAQRGADARHLAECVKNARDYLRTKHNTKVIEENLVKEIPELISYKGRKKVYGSLFLKKAEYRMFLLLEKGAAVIREYRKGGWKALMERIRVYLRIMHQVQKEITDKNKIYN